MANAFDIMDNASNNNNNSPPPFMSHGPPPFMGNSGPSPFMGGGDNTVAEQPEEPPKPKSYNNNH